VRQTEVRQNRRRQSRRRFVGAVVGVALGALLAGCSGGADAGRATSPPAGAAEIRTHDAAHSKPEPAPAALRAGEWFSRLTFARPYTPAAPNGGYDDYRCFLVDLRLSKRAFLTGSQFLPQNANIVHHHAVFYRIGPADVPAARRLDAAARGEGWTCFGGTGVAGNDPATQLADGASWTGVWTPGSNEQVVPPGTGYLLEPGSQLIMQVHFNLLRTEGKPAGTDRSSIRLRLTDGTAKLRPLRTTLLPAPVELPCAPGESGALCDRQMAVLDVMRRFGYSAGTKVAGLQLLCNKGRPPVASAVQHCDWTVRSPGTVYALIGHMHLLGQKTKVELNPGRAGARRLLDVDPYNFHDQRARLLPRPVAVRPGDTYRVTCTHDAALRRQHPELRGLPARYVVWGEGTSDEMCLAVVLWTDRHRA
jgi:hypothetical protein